MLYTATTNSTITTTTTIVGVICYHKKKIEVIKDKKGTKSRMQVKKLAYA
jgi:hypothetical protein